MTALLGHPFFDRKRSFSKDVRSVCRFVAGAVVAVVLSAGRAMADPVGLGAAAGVDPAEMSQPDVDGAGREGRLTVRWTHQGALKPGDKVEIILSGFPAYAMVEIGAGPPQSEYAVLGKGKTAANGTLQTRVTIPLKTPVDGVVVFVVSTLDYRYRAQSAELGLAGAHSPTLPPAEPEAVSPGPGYLSQGLWKGPKIIAAQFFRKTRLA